MKSKVTAFAILGVVSIALQAFVGIHAFDELPLGAEIPQGSFTMKDVSGKNISLDQVKTENGLLVIFSCNTCPYVRLNEARIKKYTDLCLENNIGCVLVNSNEAQRSEEDSFAAMIKYHTDQKLSCYYAVDGNSVLADAFGAGRTPQCFLFGKGGELVYKGAIDDNVKSEDGVSEHWLKTAISAVLNNEKPPVQQTKSVGCTIKRVS